MRVCVSCSRSLSWRKHNPILLSQIIQELEKQRIEVLYNIMNKYNLHMSGFGQTVTHVRHPDLRSAPHKHTVNHLITRDCLLLLLPGPKTDRTSNSKGGHRQRHTNHGRGKQRHGWGQQSRVFDGWLFCKCDVFSVCFVSHRLIQWLIHSKKKNPRHLWRGHVFDGSHSVRCRHKDVIIL